MVEMDYIVGNMQRRSKTMRTIDECVQSLKWGHLYEGVEAIRDEMRKESIVIIKKIAESSRVVSTERIIQAIMNAGKEEQDDE